jgi:hypothetical protein
MGQQSIDMTIGPHEGRELALMKAGKKPLSMFVVEPGVDIFPEAEFDALVSACALTKRVQDEGEVRRVLYALPGEEWRIEAMLLVTHVYSGWSPDLERVIGALLGYERGDVEAFIKKISNMS